MIRQNTDIQPFVYQTDISKKRQFNRKMTIGQVCSKKLYKIEYVVAKGVFFYTQLLNTHYWALYKLLFRDQRLFAALNLFFQAKQTEEEEG